MSLDELANFEMILEEVDRVAKKRVDVSKHLEAQIALDRDFRQYVIGAVGGNKAYVDEVMAIYDKKYVFYWRSEHD